VEPKPRLNEEAGGMDNETKDILHSTRKAAWVSAVALLVLAVSGVVAVIVLLLKERGTILPVIRPLFRGARIFIWMGLLIIAGLIVANYSVELTIRKKEHSDGDADAQEQE
jgi:hypothetical protein